MKFSIEKNFIKNNFWLPGCIKIGKNNDSFDNLNFYIYFPRIHLMNQTSFYDGQIYEVTELNLDTHISFNREKNIYWFFTFKILGFGFGVSKQNGY